MVYRRTHQVVKRLAARRSAILAAARDTAAESGMAAVQIAPVAVRANVAAGTVYRYFPSKADLISELIADVSRDELAAIRRAADAAPDRPRRWPRRCRRSRCMCCRSASSPGESSPSRSMSTSPPRGLRAGARSQARSPAASMPRCAPDICRRRTPRSPRPRCLARCMSRWSVRSRRQSRRSRKAARCGPDRDVIGAARCRRDGCTRPRPRGAGGAADQDAGRGVSTVGAPEQSLSC